MLIGLVGVERQTAVGPALVSCTVAKAGGQLDPTTTSPINFLVVFSAPVSGFNSGAINYVGSSALGTFSSEITGSDTTYNVAVSGMTTSGDVAITVVAGYTTPPNSISSSADNTVAWIAAGGGWQTLYSKTLTVDSNGWGSYSMRQVIKTAAYSPGAPATASAIRVTVNASGTSDFTADHIGVGHAAGSGDAYDYDGTQVPVLFSSGAACFISAGSLLLSDSTSYAFDKTKDLVLSASFPGVITGVKQGDFAVGEFIAGYKDTANADDTITTDASGYTTTAGRLYAFSKVEVFTSTGPTLQALFGTRYDETDAFAAHTVVLAATQALTASGFAEADAFAGHTVSATGATQALTATRHPEDDTFPSHTLVPGVVGLTATRYASDDVFATHAVLNNQPLVATGFAGDDAFATHTISVASSTTWHTLYEQTLTTDSNGWASYCVLQYIAPAAYGAGVPATGTKLRLTMRTASTVGVAFADSYVGHTATSGDVMDFDGTQVQVLWGGAAAGTTAAATTRTSDEVTYAFNKTKGLVFRMTFSGSSNITRLDGTGSNFKRSYGADGNNDAPPVTNLGPFDGTSYDTIVDGIYLLAKVEVYG